GDTLWGIVKKIYGERHDARELVYRTMQINNIKDPGRLQPGMRLYLPVIVD
ncbi:MAG: LysM peptidoglycan-binding domain-containing protein, partial [Firmicutes bacterium]|nr:LysM peptidoglycan-binding domain-containing protein [Bacillota bacterium]